jgi:hypothetical protein
MNRVFILTVAISLFAVSASAQEIPMGTWRIHNSYNSIHTISFSNTNVYAASANGVMIFNRADNSLGTFTKLDGLSSAGITQVAVDPAREQLLVTYADGNIDIVKASELINFSRLKNSTTISGSKRINHVTIRENLAYLSTDFGVVVFDLIKLEVKETYRDLGVNGSNLKIIESTFLNDSIFLATEKGILAGDVNDNLMDFNNWKRFNTGIFNASIPSVTTFNSSIFATVNASGIYRYQDGAWTLQTYLQGKSFKNISGGNTQMLITESANVWKVNAADLITAIPAGSYKDPWLAREDNEGKIWIGDKGNGLVADITGNFATYIPNGPTFSTGLRFHYHGGNTTGDELMYLVSGGYNADFSPAANTERVNYFSNGSWFVVGETPVQNATDVSHLPGSDRFIAGYGIGLYALSNGTETLFDNSNSSLTNMHITALTEYHDQTFKNRVYVAEYGSAVPLHYYDKAAGWGAFAADYSQTIEMAVDGFRQAWMVINPTLNAGIQIVNTENVSTRVLTDVPGSGGLPSRAVYSVEVDRNGYVWVGTAAGAVYFPNVNTITTSASVNAVKPIFENRFLLRDEKVTAIAVDGGNRKWMGTERGVWLFDPFGEKLIYQFNAANSPLPSDKIIDIEINHSTGEVFFMTDAGIASFRADATESTSAFSKVKIFPNPVTANFNGLVGISGLATDALVKIIDVSGKLVWQTMANGGTASWNVRDYTGNRASTGMYLVLASVPNGNEEVVGKIAVVD